MAAIRLDNLRKTFADYVAVDGLSMDIADGELLVLLGPSGCGKTTTLNCIAGLEAPSSGKIFFDAVDVSGLPPHQRNIAMVFQSSLLYPHLSARQNIAMSLKRSGLDRGSIARRIDESARILDIEALLDKMPAQLSGGERQRVATAKAIVRQPAGFLLDEPLAALDAALRLALRSELVNLQKRLNTTMIFVTHDQTEAMTMGDRIAVMQAGKVQQIGTPDEVYNRPQTLFVAGFVGSPPMNFFTGEVREDSGKTVFAGDHLALPLPDDKRALIAGRENRRFVLGVRPQHVQVTPEQRPGAMAITVFALEHLGKESVIIMETPGRDRIRAIVDPDFSARVGDRLYAFPDAGRGLLFDLSSADQSVVA